MTRTEKLEIARTQLSLDEYRAYREAINMDEIGFMDEDGNWIVQGFVTNKWDKKIFKNGMVYKKGMKLDDALKVVCEKLIESKNTDDQLRSKARSILQTM